MATRMELSLDDIIKTTPGMKKRGSGQRRGQSSPRGRVTRGGARGGGRGMRRGGGGRFSGGLGGRGGGGGRMRMGRSPADGQWTHDKFAPRTTQAGPSGGGSKITVGNLHYGVSDADIVELFGEIGPIRYASVHYDRSGRSMGKADVVFERRSDAQVAINQYNSVPLDGRPMSITYANATTTTPTVPSAPRQLRAVASGRIGVSRRMGTPNKRGVARGGQRGRGGRGGRQKQPTAAELDAELDAYISANPK